MQNVAPFTKLEIACEHCGLNCPHDDIKLEDKVFCCEGCKMVYTLINDSGLCNYYQLNTHPGINKKDSIRANKFSFLDNSDVVNQLVSFQNNERTHITFYLPSIHCSSCLYLLENLHKFDNAVLACEVHYARKEANIIFDPKKTNLRQLAETLTALGYEPYISLKDVNNAKPKTNKALIYRLGIAGFCFSNIMMMSFPEYLGLHETEANLRDVFRYLNLFLAMPVFFYSATPFFSSAWSGLKNKFLNIDLPISLAIVVTFSRSLYEIITGTGGGYFDSMAGIIFFMLLGRILQDRTHQHLEFDRDFTSYFPIAVIRLENGIEDPVKLSELKKGDMIRVYNEEIIPVDGILSKGQALIDYSFVTGESESVDIEIGEIVYAGGKQMGSSIEILIVKDVSNSYLTQLWKQTKIKTTKQLEESSFIHYLSRYFSYIVLAIATISGISWYFNDPSKILNSVTAVLIVACPCALLLSHSFANGFVLRILGLNQFFLKDAISIESIANIQHIVFDKTGTLTNSKDFTSYYEGEQLSEEEKSCLASLVSQSKHPLSKAIFTLLQLKSFPRPEKFNEFPGLGLIGEFSNLHIRLGSESFIGKESKITGHSSVCLEINGKFKGRFIIQNKFRQDLKELINSLSIRFKLSILSGDNSKQKDSLSEIFGTQAIMSFDQKPEDKLEMIKKLQNNSEKVMMIGDGLNDAGALIQSDIGIAISENNNNFTPASDIILSSESFNKLPALLALCKDGKNIIKLSFIISLVYNVFGIYFSVTGQLSPLVAAILMPASTFSIIIFTFLSSYFMAKIRGLSTSE